MHVGSVEQGTEGHDQQEVGKGKDRINDSHEQGIDGGEA